MLLTVDVGNTNIKLGVFDGNHLLGEFRLTTKLPRTSDEFGYGMRELLVHRGIDHKNIDAVIVASVVPDIMHSFQNAIRKYFAVTPLVVSAGIKTGISVATANPKEVGADRIVDAVGAYDLMGGPVIVIDFGTATTYDLVSEKGVFEAGITAPGIITSQQSLVSATAMLPAVEIKMPESILAKDTITSLQAGLVYGAIGQCEHIVAEIKKASGYRNVKVVATGGLGRIVYENSACIDRYEPQLALHGLRLIYEKNQK